LRAAVVRRSNAVPGVPAAAKPWEKPNAGLPVRARRFIVPRNAAYIGKT
jgi:hypothetical protein